MDDMNRPFGPTWQAALRRAAEKFERQEQLESEEVAAVLLAAGVVVASGIVLTARLIKPPVDWCAAREPATWLANDGVLASPRRQLN